jgi:hypothetical protein
MTGTRLPGHCPALHVTTNAKLAGLVAASPTPPDWHEPWRRLGPEPGDEERLAVYRAFRDSNSLPEDPIFYLVSWQVDIMTSCHAEVALHHLDDQPTAIGPGPRR